jgi:hypothetical protein
MSPHDVYTELCDHFAPSSTMRLQGGDLAHTHLVKGLDFALLSKIRADLEEQEAEERAAAEAAAASKGGNASGSARSKPPSSTTAFGTSVLAAVAAADKVYRASAAGSSAPRLTAAYVAQVRVVWPRGPDPLQQLV